MKEELKNTIQYLKGWSLLSRDLEYHDLRCIRKHLKDVVDIIDEKIEEIMTEEENE